MFANVIGHDREEVPVGRLNQPAAVGRADQWKASHAAVGRIAADEHPSLRTTLDALRNRQLHLRRCTRKEFAVIAHRCRGVLGEMACVLREKR